MDDKKSFLAHLHKSSAIVNAWPSWKQHALTPPISSNIKSKSVPDTVVLKGAREVKKR